MRSIRPRPARPATFSRFAKVRIRASLHWVNSGLAASESSMLNPDGPRPLDCFAPLAMTAAAGLLRRGRSPLDAHDHVDPRDLSPLGRLRQAGGRALPLREVG